MRPPRAPLEHTLAAVRRLSTTMSYKTELLPDGAKAFISGKWINSTSGKSFEVKDKYSKELLFDTANCDAQDAEIAVAASKNALPQWACETTAKERSAILYKWSKILAKKETQFAELLTKEQGKPLAEARAEIQYSASFFDWYAGEARRIYGQVVPPPKLNRQHLHIRQPIGVVCVITPWNFPSAMIARKAAAAIASGCTMIVKPAEDTPLSALALAQASQEAGLPDGVFNVIPADRNNTAAISKYVCETHDVDCISFTGSTAVGKILLSQSANTVKRMCLELGGNAPLIVFKSADIAQAVEGTIATKFRCSGQTCVSANRFYVDRSIHDEFVEKLTAAMKKLKCGCGLEKGVTQGPLINTRAVKKVSSLVDDAVSKNANVVLGGKATPNSTFFEPTLLTDVTEDMLIAQTEIFGPVVPIQKFNSEEEVLKNANNTRNGLAGYIFTKDIGQVHRMSNALQVGMIGVNEGLISCAEAAFGGVKESGLGREGGSQGIDEFTQWKYICINTA
ncbi:aldehyde dehydrogenase family domain-containing protein [Ditylenchus destructor]|uniref:Succinate-semialdehyde dehydrogenase, mitochondrial n=1 Tax=Ditylenchus destructor TaxID=166010 RepID=A0AAD4N078_9BILA|nr:aldehyde dehydrogenase family domain-containing protein [Ditylenchus destructor]